MSTTNPQHALAHDAVPATLEHRLQELGGIPADRVSAMPTPGCATLADLIQVNERQGKLCELVDGTLVEKAMGYEASVVVAAILAFLRGYASPNRLGLVSGADGFFQLPSSIRGPDVAFVHRTVAVYRSTASFRVLGPDDSLDGE